MHFEKVHLVPSVIAELYKHSLVVLEDMPATRSAMPGTIHAIPLHIEAVHIPTRENIKEAVPASRVLPETGKNINLPAFTYLGGFDKKVAIVLAEHFHPHIADEDLEFLSKLLVACKLSLNDVAIINVVNNPNMSRLWELMPSKALLLFDVDHAHVGLSFRRPHFEIQEWSGSSFMSAPALEKFRTGPDAAVQALKRQLWTGLQKIFLGK